MSRATSARTPSSSRRLQVSSTAASSRASGTTSEPAAVGVGARTSAARSQSGASCSWPTAETTGTGEDATATTASSLNGSRSSSSLLHGRARRRRPRDARRARAAPRRWTPGRPGLDARLADDDRGRREPLADRGHDVPASRRVRAREETHRARDARERALAGGLEEPLCRQHAPEALEREEVVCSEADALDRGRSDPQFTTCLPELRGVRHVDGLAFLERELEAVERPPGNRRLQRRAGRGVAQGEEDRRPRGVAAGSVTSPSTQTAGSLPR